MKTKNAIIVVLVLLLNVFMLHAKRANVAVLNIDTHGVNYTPEQMGNLLRLELEKLDTFEVMDRYDVVYLVKKNNLDVTNCYGKIGLVEAGNTIKTEKMISGSVDLYGETLIVTLRIVNVGDERIEKTFVKEFLNLPNEMQSILRVSVREMFGLRNDETLVIKLTKPFNYDNLVNTPNKERLNLSGPRMGYTLITGNHGKILQRGTENGGYNLTPAMYQIGYQFEKLYLNEGNFQALFEFIPMVTGLDQRKLIPSIAILNGIRHNLNGWEFAIGPTISLTKRADVYEEYGRVMLKKDWAGEGALPYKVTNQIDSRGSSRLTSSFVFAFGKTIRSGKLNFPINVYIIPSKDGIAYGFSFGYNAKNAH